MRHALLMLSTTLTATTAFAQDAPVDLPPLTLNSALRDERALLDTPVPVTVVERETLETKQAATFEDLLGDVPGLNIEGGPRGISQEPNIRGFSDEQIVLRFDGGRFNFGQAHRGRFFIDPELVQRVEVIRGGGSTLYGSGALGGVLSIETRDVSDLLAPGQSFGGQVTTGYASNGDIGNAGLTLFGATGSVDALAFIGTRQYGSDLQSGNGDDIRNSQIDLVNGMLKLGVEPTADQRFEFSISQYEDDGTTPANSSAASGGTADVDRDAKVTQTRLSWDYAPEGSDLLDLSALIYGNLLEITEDRLNDGRADKTEYDTWGLEVINRSSFDLGVPVSVVYGVEAFKDTQSGSRNGADRESFPDAEATTVGVFAEGTFEISPTLDLIAGLRFDQYRRDPDDDTLDDVDEDFFSPRLGFSYRPNANWQIYGNVARAFRAPSLSELYNDGTHFAVAGFPLGGGITFSGVNRFIPNPDLEPESSTQVELGARFERDGVWRAEDRLSFAVSAYRADVDDYIDQVVQFIDFDTLTFGMGGGVVDGSTTTRNIDAKLWGFEAELDYDAGRWFAGAGLAIARGTADDAGNLGSLPQDRLDLTVGLRPNADWELGARATFAADQDKVPADAETADGYEVLDLYAAWSPSTGALSNTTIRFGVDNVFDREYQIYPNGLSQPGRTFKLSATMRF